MHWAVMEACAVAAVVTLGWWKHALVMLHTSAVSSIVKHRKGLNLLDLGRLHQRVVVCNLQPAHSLPVEGAIVALRMAMLPAKRETAAALEPREAELLAAALDVAPVASGIGGGLGR